MAKRFFVRVQLHDVPEGDDAYDVLHDEMEKRGFVRTIVVDGQEHRLPWGTYIGLAENTGGSREKAANLVSAAVKATGYTSSFVVVETDTGLRVSNLEPVEQPKSLDEEFSELLKQLKG
jgi:hypothetical protein